MYRFEDVSLRKFTEKDIDLKVKWVNDPRNNRFLHYDLPLTHEKTMEWFARTQNLASRFDAVVLYKDVPVGLTGLINIDTKNKKAEEYSLIGEVDLHGKGIGTQMGHLLLSHAFYELDLNRLYATIELGNEASLRRVRKLGGIVEGYLHENIVRDGSFVDEYQCCFLKSNYKMPPDIICL